MTGDAAATSTLQTSASVPAPMPVSSPNKVEPFERQVRRALRRRVYLQAAGVWAITRVIMVMFTFVATAFAHAWSSPYPATPLQRRPVTLHSLVVVWNIWDAWHFYMPIAANGYDPHNTIYASFFPLYPLLVHLVTLVPGVGPHHTAAAGLVVSNLALLAALMGIGALVLEYGRPGARAPRLATVAVWLVVASPLAFFLTAPYADSLLLAAATWSLVCMRRGWIYPAALCALVAALAHITALALVPALLFELGCQRGWWRKPWWWQSRPLVTLRVRALHLSLRLPSRRALPRMVGEPLAVALAVPLGIGLFAAYCARVYGRWDAFVVSERTHFGQTPMWPWQAIGTIARSLTSVPAGSYMQVRQLVDVLPLLLVWALVLIRLREQNRLPGTLSLFLAALLVLAIAAPVQGTLFPDPALAAGRHMLLGAGPVAVALLPTIRRWPWLETALLCAGLLLQGMLAAFFLHGGWIV